jgi:hypothetical protein
VAPPSSGEAFAVLAQIYRDGAVETGERSRAVLEDS